MRLFRSKRDAPAVEAQPRRRRAPRADGPRTIVPIVDDAAAERPSWLKAEAPRAVATLALDLDAARDRLRREIPPVEDDDR